MVSKGFSELYNAPISRWVCNIWWNKARCYPFKHVTITPASMPLIILFIPSREFSLLTIHLKPSNQHLFTNIFIEYLLCTMLKTE